MSKKCLLEISITLSKKLEIFSWVVKHWVWFLVTFDWLLTVGVEAEAGGSLSVPGGYSSRQ